MTACYASRYGPVTPVDNGRNGPFLRARSRVRVVYLTTNYWLVSCWKSLKGFSNNSNTEVPHFRAASAFDAGHQTTEAGR